MGPLREDFAGQRQLRFRVEGETLHLFKAKGESSHQVYLKVLAYALYRDQFDLTIDPKIDCKYQPDVASFDLTGEVQLWIRCGPFPTEQIVYVLKHTDAKHVIWVQEHPAGHESKTDFSDLDNSGRVASIRKQVHYRYANGKLKLLVFRPLDGWFDPDDVILDPHNYQLFEF